MTSLQLSGPGPRLECGGRPGRAGLAALALLVLLAGAACSPAYDWREWSPPGAGWAALLPGRPATATRDILLGESRVTMTMHGARVGETSFTVASATLPDAQPATRERALAAMRQALVRNLDGREMAAAPVELPVVDASGRRVGTAAGLSIEASGRIGETPGLLLAQLVVRDARAVQALVVGPMIDRDQAQTFFDSLRLRE